MKLLIQGVHLLAAEIPSAADGVDSGSRHSPWWVIGGALAIMTLCWFALSVMSKGQETSLWKDDDSEMNSSSDVGSSG